MSKNKNSSDALLLAIVKLFTLSVGIISTMILSKKLSLQSYGTYSTLNLIATSGTAISVLGLADAMNYFYNKENNEITREKYVNSIFLFQIMIGVATGIIILVSEPIFRVYFDNPMIKGMCIYIAFRPLLENVIISLQNLQVAIGRAKKIAIRNAVFSLVKIIAIILGAVFLKDIRIILFSTVFMDAVTVIYFAVTFSKVEFKINIMKFDISLTKEILMFSVPMGIYVMSNILMREFDKYVIGYFEPTQILAIYTNCSTILPLDIITNSFLIIIIPIMTRYISNNDYKRARELFTNYIMIGIYSTIVFGVALIFNYKEVISFLYDDKYLSGRYIFIIYIIVSMIKFANLTLILSAKGRTKTLMKISIVSLIANGIINIIFYKVFGVIGPALSTICVTIITIIIMCKESCRILETSIMKILNWREILIVIGEIVLSTTIFKIIKIYLNYINLNKYIILFICAGGFILFMLSINYKKIKRILKAI